MDRPAPKPGHVRTEPPGASPPEVAAIPEPPRPPRPSISTGWRIALFVWVTAFGFLAAYELLWMAFKLLKIR